MSQYFPTPSSHKENIKVEIELSIDAKKKTEKMSMILLMQILQNLH